MMASNQPCSDPAEERLLQAPCTSSPGTSAEHVSSVPAEHDSPVHATKKTSKDKPHSAVEEQVLIEHSSSPEHDIPKTTKNQPLRISTKEPPVPLLKKHFGSKAIAQETLCITPSPSPISPSVSHASQTPSPCIQPTVYFNFEMVESHYTRDETCMEKHNIFLKLCAVISCCTFILVTISAGKMNTSFPHRYIG